MRLIWSQRSLGSCSVCPGGKNRGHYGSQGSSLAPQTTDPTNTSSSSSSLGLHTHRTAALERILGFQLIYPLWRLG